MPREGWIRRGGRWRSWVVRCFGGFTADYMIHAVFKELAKGTFFGEHAFIHIGEIVMIALLMAGVVGVYLHQAGSRSQARPASI